ncbi:hypothetical protein ONR57_21145 [Hoyosella sp. YIM 151337]|uniref:hypothetical protein n=1 Tax=Hoyosella sp. YIM 151337 TaxID=2992742 RepID=UPI0022363886|nr:hypothetical protein [Hoyosella sp. YIM 151337]MCW4355814.1 hypothetical protein [Hoyosella sp. YIM 151337]
MTLVNMAQRINVLNGSTGERLGELQSRRLTELVQFARTHSPFYRGLYDGVPQHVTDPAVLPVTNKAVLMEDFDDWSTDREITRDAAEAFVSDPEMIGHKFLGKYLVSTTSGTSGYRGIFLMSEEELAQAGRINLLPQVVDFLKKGIVSGAALRLVRGRLRSASIIATGAHHILNSIRLRSSESGRRKGSNRNIVLSVLQPVSELVRELNAFQPVMLSSYAGIISILASEQEKGTLSIRPALVALTGEGLPTSEYARIERVFGARVIDSYGCSEAITMSRSCEHRWHHILSDWIIVEPVDEDWRPVPPGTLSHTTLLTVLYRKTQPIIRYDLGDAVLQRPDPCPCGNPNPAVRVSGRAVDLLRTPDGAAKTSAALVVESLAAKVDGIRQLQLLQTGPATLEVRLVPDHRVESESVWTNTLAVLARLLADNELEYTLKRGTAPPELSPGGKLRQFIPAAPSGSG